MFGNMFGNKEIIKINDEEKEMFNSLWQIYEGQDHLGIENFPQPPEKMLNSFVEYLALKYRFDPNNFTIHDKKGRFIHTRVERPKENVN